MTTDRVIIIPIGARAPVGVPSEPFVKKWNPGHYIKTTGNQADADQNDYWNGVDSKIIETVNDIPEILGAYVTVAWGVFNTTGSTYDWSRIDNTLNLLKSYGKKMILEVTYKSFTPRNNPDAPDFDTCEELVPNDLVSQADVTARGWWGGVHRTPIMTRFISALEVLIARYDTDPSVEMIVTPEPSPSFEGFAPSDYDKDAYVLELYRLYDAGSAVAVRTNFCPAVNELTNSSDPDGTYADELMERLYTNRDGIAAPDCRPNITAWQIFENNHPAADRDYRGQVPRPGIVSSSTIHDGLDDVFPPVGTPIYGYAPDHIDRCQQQACTHVSWITWSQLEGSTWTDIKAAIQADPLLHIDYPTRYPTAVSAAQFTLSATSYTANQPENIEFTIFRTINTDQELTVDWTIAGISVLQFSGTETFNPGDTQVNVSVATASIGADQQGSVTLSNPTYISGPVSAPIIGTPGSAIIYFFATIQLTAQDLRDFGFLLPEDYGAYNDGTNAVATTNAINAAMIDSEANSQTVCFQAGKTYLVSDTIRVGEWFDPDADSSTFPSLTGLGKGANRPRIVLDDGATNFGNPGSPRPVICVRNFDHDRGASQYSKPNWPSDPMATGSGTLAANLFNTSIENIIVDCGNNAGAFGLFSPMAQESFMADIEVDCSQALGGIWGFPGRNMVTTNIKIIGGVWQIWEESIDSQSSAGVMIAGLELVGDFRTTTPIHYESFIPLTIVGFDITRPTLGSIVEIQPTSKSQNKVVLIDGIIRAPAGGRMIDNAEGKGVYMRNVYITGTNDIVQSGGLSAHNNVIGTWKRVNEYCYSDLMTYDYTTGRYPNYSVVNGSITGPAEHEPVVDIDSDVAAPTVDYIARHTIDIVRIGDGPYENIESHGAQSGESLGSNSAYENNRDATTPDSRGAIEAAILAAKNAGHNTVFVPRGFYYVSSPGIYLDEDTKFIGVHQLSSKIGVKANWQPTSQVYVITSPNSATATTHMSHVQVSTRVIDPFSPTTTQAATYDNFSFVLWRSGVNSSSIHIHSRQWTNPFNLTNKKSFYEFAQNAGGKHYNFNCPGRFTNNPDHRGIRVTGTSAPLHLYGCNVEAGKKTTGNQPTTINIEIQNASNVRLYASKREGDAATCRISSSQNVCFYGLGRQVRGQESGGDFTIGIFDNSDDILIAPCTYELEHQNDPLTSADPMLLEDVTGHAAVQIDWPLGVSYYRRGTPDDSLVEID